MTQVLGHDCQEMKDETRDVGAVAVPLTEKIHPRQDSHYAHTAGHVHSMIYTEIFPHKGCAGRQAKSSRGPAAAWELEGPQGTKRSRRSGRRGFPRPREDPRRRPRLLECGRRPLAHHGGFRARRALLTAPGTGSQLSTRNSAASSRLGRPRLQLGGPEVPASILTGSPSGGPDWLPRPER